MLVANHIHGLGNRLRALLSVMVLSPSDYGIHWGSSKDGYLWCTFNDLFENDIAVNNVVGCDIYDSWRFAVVDADYIDWKFEEAPYHQRRPFIEAAKELIPVKYIRDQVEEFSEKFNDKTMSIHMRSWGDTLPHKKKCWYEGMKGFKIENFYHQIDMLPENNFFVATDKDKYADMLKSKYPDRIITRPKRCEVNATKDAVQDALIEMLLLGKTQALIGSRFSTYSEIAWYFGGCKQKTAMLGGKGSRWLD